MLSMFYGTHPWEVPQKSNKAYKGPKHQQVRRRVKTKNRGTGGEERGRGTGPSGFSFNEPGNGSGWEHVHTAVSANVPVLIL